MKKISALLACTLFAASLGLAACASDVHVPTSADVAQDIEQASEPDYTTGTPWLACDIDGTVSASTPTDPKDDFGLYVNKDALLSLELSDSKPTAGLFSDLSEQEDEDLKKIFHEASPQSHDAKLAYDLFWLLEDWDGRNALGIKPLKDRIDAIDKIGSIDELNTYFTTLPPEERAGAPWRGAPNTDPSDSTRKIISFGNAKLMLGDSAEYETRTDFGEMTEDACRTLVKKVLGKAGYSEQEANEKFDNCLAFDKLLAPAICTRDERQSPDYISRSNRHYTRSEVESMQGKLPVLQVLEQSEGYPACDSYLVAEPEFFAKLNEVYTDENLGLLKDYLIVNSAINSADLLDRDCYEWFYEAMGALNGTSELPDDDTYAVGAVNRLSGSVTRLYSEAYLKQEDKDRISALIDEIIDAYHDILNDADFISDETRAHALEKLDAIDKRVLFPDDWSAYGYDGLSFASKEEGGVYWDADKAISKYLRERDIQEFSQPVDKSKWAMLPHEVNCAYDQQTNSIYITGAFARGEVYNSNMSDEELYGKLGAVIGHEISHAFDQSGSQFDKDGNLANWWTDEDAQAFAEKNQKLAAYLSSMHPWEGQNLTGENMAGEACADMAGMKCMLGIAAQKPGFDYDAFFRAFAQLWLCKETPMLAQQMVQDVHPMDYLRVNMTLQQYDEFLDCYGIKEGDGMYLAPQDRVTIW